MMKLKWTCEVRERESMRYTALATRTWQVSQVSLSWEWVNKHHEWSRGGQLPYVSIKQWQLGRFRSRLAEHAVSITFTRHNNYAVAPEWRMTAAGQAPLSTSVYDAVPQNKPCAVRTILEEGSERERGSKKLVFLFKTKTKTQKWHRTLCDCESVSQIEILLTHPFIPHRNGSATRLNLMEREMTHGRDFTPPATTNIPSFEIPPLITNSRCIA